MPTIDLRLPPAVLQAITDRARSHGLSRHAWAISTLDRVAGVRPADEPGTAVDRPAIGRSGRMKLRLSSAQHRAYSASAGLCELSVATWAAMILAAAAGASRLGEQLKRVA